MSVQRLSSRYAKSLLDLAVENNKLDRVKEDMEHFLQVCGVRDFYLVMKSPIIKPSKKQSIMNALFKEAYDPLTMAFLDIILRKGREAYLPEIANAFLEQYRHEKRISAVHLTTAVELTEAELEQFRKAIAASGATYPNIELNADVDPDIIGGFIIEFDDKQYDASISHKLDALRKQFS